MWKKSHIWCQAIFIDVVVTEYIRQCHPVASQSEIIAYRWFKVTAEWEGEQNLFLLSLSYRETFFIATSWLKTFSFTSESSNNNNKSRCETFVAFSFYESFIMNNEMDFWT